MFRGFTYTTAMPARPCNSLSGIALVRPARQVFGQTAMQKAEWALAIAICDIAGARRHHDVCCAELGKANAYGRVSQRAAYKATAFRQTNKARAQRRAALKVLAAAQDAMLAFALVEAA